jgi:glycine cleavage system aminomethyltransferase T
MRELFDFGRGLTPSPSTAVRIAIAVTAPCGNVGRHVVRDVGLDPGALWRIGFTGELGFDVHAPAGYGLDKQDFMGLPELVWHHERGDASRLVALRASESATVPDEGCRLVTDAGPGRPRRPPLQPGLHPHRWISANTPQPRYSRAYRTCATGAVSSSSRISCHSSSSGFASSQRRVLSHWAAT